LFLIIVVLLQSGKAADLAGAFGGMGSQTAFGPRGAATLLTKATAGAAIVFMMTSISLGIWHGRMRSSGDSVIERTGTGQAPAGTFPGQSSPATPAPAAGGNPFDSIVTETEQIGGETSTPTGELTVETPEP
jgi:preprotein translocase subunit SecG